MALSSYAQEMLNSHEYVLFGQVTNDPIEKQFGKYRQCAGTGTYLVKVCNIDQRFSLDKAQEYVNSVGQLQLPETNHACSLCSVNVDLDLNEIFQSESELPISVRQGLIYIVTKELPVLNELLEDDDTINKYTNYGQMIAEGNRGGLSIPRDSEVYFTYYCYIAFALQPTNLSQELYKLFY